MNRVGRLQERVDNVPNLDTVLNVCGHKHRRIVLATLTNQQQSLSIDELTNAILEYNHHQPRTEVDDETTKRIRIGLSQVHLPKLADAGVIQYDPGRNMVELSTHARREDAHLSAILALDSDLPTTD